MFQRACRIWNVAVIRDATTTLRSTDRDAQRGWIFMVRTIAFVFMAFDFVIFCRAMDFKRKMMGICRGF